MTGINITKDGIYTINSDRNPFAKYLIVKHYGQEIKRKAMSCYEDCKQQIDEWDEDYLNECNDKTFKKGLANLNKLVAEELGIVGGNYEASNRRSYLYVYKDNKLVFEGDSLQCSTFLDVLPKRVNECARSGKALRSGHTISKVQLSPAV